MNTTGRIPVADHEGRENESTHPELRALNMLGADCQVVRTKLTKWSKVKELDAIQDNRRTGTFIAVADWKFPHKARHLARYPNRDYQDLWPGFQQAKPRPKASRNLSHRPRLPPFLSALASASWVAFTAIQRIGSGGQGSALFLTNCMLMTSEG